MNLHAPYKQFTQDKLSVLIRPCKDEARVCATLYILLCSLEQVQALTPLEDPQKKLPFVQDTLSGIRSEVGNRATVLGFVGTPWTLAAYSVEGKADK